MSRLDYCNSVLCGLPASTLQPLTTVLHCAAKLIKNLSDSRPPQTSNQIDASAHTRSHKFQYLAPDVPSPYKLFSLVCFLTCYTLFISPIQKSSTIFIHLKLIVLSHDQLENLETVLSH